MKTAIYIEDGVVQLVITPQTEFEKNALSSFQEKPLQVQIFKGSFYDCRGGWVRQEVFSNPGPYGKDNEDKSLILKIAESQEKDD